MGFFDQTFYHNAAWQWFAAVGVVIATWFVLQIAARLAIRRLRAAAARTEGQFDDLLVELLRKTRFVLVSVIAAYAGSRFLSLPTDAVSILRTLFILAFLAQAGTWGNGLVSFWLGRAVQKRYGDDGGAATSLAALSFVLKVVIWSVILLLALDNLGVDVTGLIAGLGIGGIAIALGLQSILRDLFASLSIVVDRPFVIGDFIAVGDFSGTVERIGLKTTRVRSLSGEQLVFSNNDLLESRLRNFMRMAERRVSFGFGLAFDTPAQILGTVPTLVREQIERVSSVRFDRAHLKSIGDSVLTFEVVFYVLENDYSVFMDAQQKILLGILAEFEARGIRLAHPTQTVHVRRTSLEDE
ncbi:MAG: mechanosensitive ion channel domain-containing protein [Candidatus Bipolaricaulota bacterium]